jgi:hypothetical protein
MYSRQNLQLLNKVGSRFWKAFWKLMEPEDGGEYTSNLVTGNTRFVSSKPGAGCLSPTHPEPCARFFHVVPTLD